MARLSVAINGEKRNYPLTERGIQIGRALDNDIVLNNVIVSRHHAHVSLRGREAWAIDLGSRNGISVNRLRVKEEQLQDGDMLQIGPFEIRYEDRAAQSVVFDDNQYFPLASEAREIKSGELPDMAIDLREFYRISKRLNSILDLHSLLDAVMEEVLRTVPAQRGILLLRKGTELVPMIIHPASQGDLAISSTITRKAVDANEAVLTRDARLDFAGSQSIISANIRSAICAPLISEGTASGLIYVDSAGRDQFNEQQRDMLAAVANLAATHIERARLTDALREQAQLRQNFERFMSPNVAQLMASYFVQHGQLWEPQELIVTVLFADVKDFTALSERLSPRDVQDLLNEYFHEMTEVIFRHNGTLDKYIGDGIMAVFGAPQLTKPIDPEESATQAVNAALDMVAAHQRLIERLDPAKAFAFRIGINSGPVYAGFFGTRQRLEYTVMGDTVNTASRLEGKADLNSTLISEATRRLVGDAFQLQAMGEFQLKGKAQLVHTYKVLGRHNALAASSRADA
ncbi:MAG TPA: adenylate/guanylate cyclase domain-containing protein [Kouleothrix sp.]|uniref:adenylate/guanylate cyclase domain-containing protein n=1 Tax=Kouleothrix sp. TaxID=2779161 RepID=UPI002C1FA2CC|nr:adenylate/guanylate cyclase domain-containing protein [Kouleothrix sp.]HRC76614.1 adenylate/guanylate cyclase domain-containing protein [Kouleothrix sp.]